MPIRQFERVPLNLIREPEATDYPEELRQSIESVGLINPITLQREEGHPSRPYRILTGQRRFRVAEALGWDRIDAMVSMEEYVPDQSFITYTENMARSNNLRSEIQAIRDMLQNGMTLEEIRGHFHLGGVQFLHRARVAGIAHTGDRQFIIQLVSAGDMTLATASRLAGLTTTERRMAIRWMRALTADGFPVNWARIQSVLGSDQLSGSQTSFVIADEVSEVPQPLPNPFARAVEQLQERVNEQARSTQEATQAIDNFNAAVATANDGGHAANIRINHEHEVWATRLDANQTVSVIRVFDRNFIREDVAETERIRDLQQELRTYQGRVIRLEGELRDRRSAHQTPPPAPVLPPDFWWRRHYESASGVSVSVDDIRGTRGLASVAALLEAAEAALPQEDMALADEVASKINWLMNRLTIANAGYQRNVRPPALTSAPRVVVGIDLANQR